MESHLIIPMLVCRDAAAEVAFCERVFGAVVLSRREGEGGFLMHATLKMNGMLLMVHDVSAHLASRAPEPDGSSSVVIYVYGDSVDPIIAKAVAAGARVLLPPADQAWGDRVGRIVDPEGHVWNLAARIHDDPSPS